MARTMASAWREEEGREGGREERGKTLGWRCDVRTSEAGG